ncbi:MAG TPA: hypothetical protein V6D23_15075 [Candidatus Obscuribacterales bacterium]
MKRQLLPSALLASLLALPARADIAVPVTAYYLGSLDWAIPLLLPIVAIEAFLVWYLLGRHLSYSFWKVLAQLAFVNATTALLGIAVLVCVDVYTPEPLFLLQLGLTIVFEFLLLYRYYAARKRPQRVSPGLLLGVTALINLPSYLLLFGLLYAFYEGSARFRGVKPYMENLQNMVETYAVDSGGLFPENLAALEAAASKPDTYYWRELNRPRGRGFFHDLPPGASLVLLPGETPRPDSISYKPIMQAGKPCGYEIEGYDYQGKPIVEKDSAASFRVECP